MNKKYENINENNNKIKPITFVIIAVVIVIVSIILIIKENDENYYLILDNHKVIEYKEGKYNYTDNNFYKPYYRVFNDNTYLGRYNIYQIDEFTHEVFFTNPESVGMFAFENPLLAISDNIDKIDYKISEFTNDDFTVFYDLSSKDYIKSIKDLYDTSKVVLDFDNDGKNESLYTVTYENLDNDEIEISEKNYSIMYYLDHNGETTILAEGEPYYEGESILFPNYIVRSIVDITGDKNYEIIVTNRMHDEPVYEIYELIDGKYTMMFATDLGGVYEK